MSASGPFQDKPSLNVAALALARGGRMLFDGLSFVVAPGGYLEIRGANGAGKTSLLRAIAGFLKPRAGAVTFANTQERESILHFIGHLNGLKPTPSVRAHVRYWASLFGAPAPPEALTRLGLADQADLPARVLSAGQARRLALSRLLIARRPVWLLDEPAAGLDGEGRKVLADLIEAHRGNGGLVLAAVHEALGPAPSQTVTLGA